ALLNRLSEGQALRVPEQLGEALARAGNPGSVAYLGQALAGAVVRLGERHAPAPAGPAAEKILAALGRAERPVDFQHELVRATATLAPRLSPAEAAVVLDKLLDHLARINVTSLRVELLEAALAVAARLDEAQALGAAEKVLNALALPVE